MCHLPLKQIIFSRKEVKMCGEVRGIGCSYRCGYAKVFVLSRDDLPREENVNRARCGNAACLQLHLSSADTCSMQPAKAVDAVREVCGRWRGQRQCSALQLCLYTYNALPSLRRALLQHLAASADCL